MRWSLNEIVVESSCVECELCSGDCRGDGTEVQTTGKIIGTLLWDDKEL